MPELEVQQRSHLFERVIHTPALLTLGQLDARFKLITNGLEHFFWCHHTTPVQKTCAFGILLRWTAS